jgi:hypothetical protein
VQASEYTATVGPGYGAVTETDGKSPEDSRPNVCKHRFGYPLGVMGCEVGITSVVVAGRIQLWVESRSVRQP